MQETKARSVDHWSTWDALPLPRLLSTSPDSCSEPTTPEIISSGCLAHTHTHTEAALSQQTRDTQYRAPSPCFLLSVVSGETNHLPRKERCHLMRVCASPREPCACLYQCKSASITLDLTFWRADDPSTGAQSPTLLSLLYRTKKTE